MYSRHELVWLTAAGWKQALRGPHADPAAVALFCEHDWPAVVRRREPGLGCEQLSLGLPLPPAADGGKRRCGLQAPLAAVARRAPPLPLAQVAPQAPPHWRAPLAALLADSARESVELAVFGSAAMQALTGMSYLTAASDLDLLLQPSTPAELHAGVALLLRHAAFLPLDGEIVFPGGAAVSWKEWAAGQEQRVLVKHVDGVRLARKGELAMSLAPP